jgi:hypothetical protein
MKPALLALLEQLMTPDTLAGELELAKAADGMLPRFLSEQRSPRDHAQTAADERAAWMARGAAALARRDAGHELTEEDADECFDPIDNGGKRRRSR